MALTYNIGDTAHILGSRGRVVTTGPVTKITPTGQITVTLKGAMDQAYTRRFDKDGREIGAGSSWSPAQLIEPERAERIAAPKRDRCSRLLLCDGRRHASRPHRWRMSNPMTDVAEIARGWS